jgi:predicted secreted Zn-dependent protease
VDNSSFETLEAQLWNALLASTVRAREHHQESTMRRGSTANAFASDFGEAPECGALQAMMRSKASARSFPLHYQAQASWCTQFKNSRVEVRKRRDFSSIFFILHSKF